MTKYALSCVDLFSVPPPFFFCVCVYFPSRIKFAFDDWNHATSIILLFLLFFFLTTRQHWSSSLRRPDEPFSKLFKLTFAVAIFL